MTSLYKVRNTLIWSCQSQIPCAHFRWNPHHRSLINRNLHNFKKLQLLQNVPHEGLGAGRPMNFAIIKYSCNVSSTMLSLDPDKTLEFTLIHYLSNYKGTGFRNSWRPFHIGIVALRLMCSCQAFTLCECALWLCWASTIM